MTLPTLPPGTILQLMYLKERLKDLKPGCFLEVGCGIGIISYVLLKAGWSGIGIDLNDRALARASQVNEMYIQRGKYLLLQQDFFELELQDKYDLVISCMVLEHLDDELEILYLQKTKNILSLSGRIILLVPGCPCYWGIEDEIAGHCRRYTRSELQSKLVNAGYKISKIAGLTYPLSNWLYPISEFLVKKSEYNLIRKNREEKTKLSGLRNVKFKTNFPSCMKVILNDLTMYPFHILQKLYSDSDSCMVIYAEAIKL